MRFTTALFAFVAAVSAQTGTATTSAAPASTSALTTAEIQCLEACGDSDVNCRATCVLVPNPNEAQVNATTECVAACPQGNGTEAETQAYITCRDGCIDQFYYNTQSGTPSGTSGSNSGSGSSASASATGSGSSSASSSGSSGSASSTGSSGSSSSDSATTDTSGASLVSFSSGLGLIGVFVAALAL
ncbi:hypothetical protein BROUX41_004582 [Berkeleyomyces rouxiae]|uniref:uncharacterized protein n=1 Tax=Berkeleyomyces rouxiae TaxID=2035830 RepID=UPI003B7679FC